MPRGPTLYILDDLIRRGKLALVRRELGHLAGTKLTRERALGLATMAWRAQAPHLGVAWLSRVVRPRLGERPGDPAQPMEKAIYAGCLTQLGAIEEALDLLDGIEPDDCPLALFIKMTALVARWEYGQAIPVIEAYLDTKPPPYQALMARVNLVASLVFEHELEAAEALLDDLGKTLVPAKSGRLYAYLLQLESLVAWHRRDLPRMEKCLHTVAAVLGREGGKDAVILRKWEAVAALTARSDGRRELVKLHEVKADAVAVGHWETARDCDLFEAVLRQDERLLWHVYFGTPFPNYRVKLLRLYGRPPAVPPFYDWLHGRKAAARPTLDLETGEVTSGTTGLRQADALHRLALCLASDFYRPQRVSTLHARTYPGEFFNPASSPLKVRQLILRLRRWCRSEKLPLLVEQIRGEYQLKAVAAFAIRTKENPLVPRRSAPELDRLRLAYRGESFSWREAQLVLERPDRTVRRLLKAAVEEGDLERTGLARRARYRFQKG